MNNHSLCLILTPQMKNQITLVITFSAVICFKCFLFLIGEEFGEIGIMKACFMLPAIQLLKLCRIKV